MGEKKNPGFWVKLGLGVASIVADKVVSKKIHRQKNLDSGELEMSTDVIVENLAPSISSKRLLNLTGTTGIVGVGLSQIASNGLSWEAIALVGIGVLFSLGMSWMQRSS